MCKKWILRGFRTAGLECNRGVGVADQGLIFGMGADDIGDQGLERRQRQARCVLTPSVRVGTPQFVAGMGVECGHGRAAGVL